MKEETKWKILFFFISCIPGIIVISIKAFVPHEDVTGMMLSLLTFVSWCIPIMYIMMLSHASEYQYQQKQMLNENEEYYKRMQNL